MDEIKNNLNQAKRRAGVFAKSSPEFFGHFSKLAGSATKEGVFSSAQKEIMAVSIAVALKCDDCIYYHVDNAKKYGATEEELIEALEVSVEMAGGPAVMYAGKAIEIYRGLA